VDLVVQEVREDPGDLADFVVPADLVAQVDPMDQHVRQVNLEDHLALEVPVDQADRVIQKT
jgi:hypothetical protein